MGMRAQIPRREDPYRCVRLSLVRRDYSGSILVPESMPNIVAVETRGRAACREGWRL